MEKKKILFSLLLFVCMLFTVNATTTLTTCGEPSGGWQSGETYIINLDEVNSTSSPESNYCFDLSGYTGLHDITFENKLDSQYYINLQNDYSLFNVNANSTDFTFRNFFMNIQDYGTARPMFMDIYNLNSIKGLDDFYQNFRFEDMSLSANSPNYASTNFFDFGTSGNGIAYAKGWEFDNVKVVTDDYVFRMTGAIYISYCVGTHTQSITFLYIDLKDSLLLAENKVTYMNRPTVGYSCGFSSSTGYGAGGRVYVTGDNYVYNGLLQSSVAGGNGQIYAGYTDILEDNSTNYITDFYSGDVGSRDMFGYKIYQNASGVSSMPSNQIVVMAETENFGFTNSVDLNTYDSIIDLSFAGFNLDGLWGLNLFHNSLDCNFLFSTNCVVTDVSNSEITGFSNAGMITTSGDGYIRGIDLQQAGLNDASMITHSTGGSYSDLSIINNDFYRLYPSDLATIYQTMIDITVDNLLFDKNVFEFAGTSHEYRFIENTGDNVTIINNDFTVTSPNGDSDLPHIYLNGNTFDVEDNTFTLSGDAGNDISKYSEWFNIIGNNVLFTNNYFVNTITNVNTTTNNTKSRVFDNVGSGYFYHNWLDNNMIITMDEFTTLEINKLVPYEYNGRIYEFTIGNYYDGYSNTCDDLNTDGFCDTPYILPNGQVDNFTLAEYPYNFEEHLLFAQNFFDFEEFNVDINNIVDGNKIILSNELLPLNINYQHTASGYNMTCNVFLDNVLIDVKSDVQGNIEQTTEYYDWVYDKIYDLEVKCFTGNYVERSSGEISFFISDIDYDDTPDVNDGDDGGTTGGGGGGGGDTTPDEDGTIEDGTVDCNEDYLYTCSNGDEITLLQCANGKYYETGEECGTCSWWDTNCEDEIIDIIENSTLPIYGSIDEGIIESLISSKEICNIDISPTKLEFTEDGEILSFTIINNQDGSYSPDYKFENVDNYDSAIQSLTVTNELGTLQNGGSTEIGIAYSIGTFTPETSKDLLTLTSDNCADISVTIVTQSDTGFIGENYGGGIFGPSIDQLSTLLDLPSYIDLIYYGVLGGLFTMLNWNRTFGKTNTKKGKKRSRIIKGILISIYTFTSGIALLIILNAFL